MPQSPLLLRLSDGREIRVRAGLSPEETDAIVQDAMRSSLPSEEPEERQSTATPLAAIPKSADRRMGGTLTSTFPQIGGLVGSLVGGSKAFPAGMGLAAAGGAVGEAYRQAADAIRGDFSNIPDTVGGRLRKIGTEGLIQGGLEGAGRALVPVAKTIYGIALRPSQALIRDAGGGHTVRSQIAGLRRIVDQGVSDAVLPSGLGVGRARNLVQAGKDAATAMAARSPARADMRDIIDPAANDVLTRMIDEASTAGVAADLARPAEQLATLAKTNPSSLTMSDVLRIRRGAEDVADPVFAAAKKPGGPGRVAPGTEASTARSIAGAAQRVLEQEHNLGKAFADLNRQTQARALVSRAVDDAAVRPHGLANVLSMGVGAGTSGGDPVEAIKRGLMMRALLSQSALGAGALVAARTPAANIARSGDILLKLLGATTHDDPR